jgi:hypothetical protein
LVPVAFRLRCCCLCRRTVPSGQDVHDLDAEWQRRFPSMVGTLACERCVNQTHWKCRESDSVPYPAGHVPAVSGRQCFDAASHVRGYGTQRAMMIYRPQPAMLQGGEAYLRDVATRHDALAASVAAALRECDADRAGV